MKMERRILTAVIALCMITGLIVYPERTEQVQAAVYEDFEYKVYTDENADSTVMITKYNGAAEEVSIPGEIDGMPVTAIGDGAFKDCKSICSVYDDEETIISVGNEAFSGCTNLNNIFTNYLLNIGEEAFRGCTSLTGFFFVSEAAVIRIGSRAFYGCTSLTDVYIEVGCSVQMGSWAFEDCKNLQTINLQPAASIEEGTFSGCIALTSMILPSGLTSIGEQAFSGCAGLEEIIIPSTVTRIERSAFNGCDMLSELYYSGTAEQWENISVDLDGNGVLADLHVNDSTVNDPEMEYEYSSAGGDIGGDIVLLKYTGTDTAVEIPTRLFNKRVKIVSSAYKDHRQLTEVTIPEGIFNLINAFENCSSLKKVKIPASMVKMPINGSRIIGRGCVNLQTIEVADGNDIFSAEDGVLYDKNKRRLVFCPEGKEGALQLPDGVTEIGASAFEGCSLTEIRLPDSVTEIGKCAFQNCANLKDLYYAGTREQWNDINISKGNEDLQNIEIHFGDGTTLNGSYQGFKYVIVEAEEAGEVETIEITGYEGTDSVVKVPAEINGILVTSIGFDAFLDNDTIQEITIPSGVTKLGSLEDGMLGCFGTCPNLKAIHVEESNPEFSSEDGVLFTRGKDVLIRYPSKKEGAYTVPSSVTDLVNNAFEDCESLTEVILPDSVTNIGEAAFIDCIKLEKVSLPSGIDSIKEYTFSGCEKLKEIEIPSGVWGIGYGCFEDCTGLTSVTVPASMEAVEALAFSRCSSLWNVYYSGIKSQWDKIDIDTSPSDVETNANAALLNAVIHFSDDTVLNGPLDDIPEELGDAREELEKLMSGGTLSLDADFQHYMSGEQMNIIESFLYTWLAEINYAYKYPSGSGVKELVMKKAGIDPEGDFASGREQAVTHISVMTKYGPKTFEITLDLGAPDGSGNLYPAYGAMRYEILEKRGIPAGLPTEGMIGKASYPDMKAFAECVSRKSEDSLHQINGWESLQDEIAAGVLIDKTVSEMIGNKNGSFSDGMMTVYAVPLFTYSKTIIITSTVDVNVYIYTTGKILVGSIVDRQPSLNQVQDGEAFLYAGRGQCDAGQTAGRGQQNAQQTAGGEQRYVWQTVGAENQVLLRKAGKAAQKAQQAGIVTQKAQQADITTQKARQTDSAGRNVQQAGGEDQNVQIAVDGDTKTVYLAGDDYYLQVQGTGAGKMNYEVEETANKEVRRTVQFLEMQLEKDMQYDGYVFRPLNIDRDMYALRTQDSQGQDVVYQGQDRYEPAYQPSFKKVQGISISQQNTSMDTDRTVQLNAKISPLDASNPDLRWMTDNDSVVRVDSSGRVTAVGAGRATITVMTKDGSFLKQYCMIDVAGSSGTDNPGSSGTDNPGGSGTDNPGGTGGSSGADGSGTGSSGSFGGSGAGSPGGSGTGSLGGADSSGSAGQGNAPVVSGLHYVIQFHVNGGTNLSRRTMTLLADDSPGIMPKAQRRDYTFEGWYTQQEGGTQVTGDSPLGEAVTLYARWTRTEAPEASSITLIARKKGRVQVSFQKVSKAAGYQIDYSESKKFKDAQTKEVKASARAKTIAGLAAGKKYYIRMRAYRVDSMGNRVYGEYGAVKSVKVKA